MTSTATTANGSNVPSRWSNVFSLDRHRARYESARVEPDDASTPHSVTPTLTADVVNANDSLTHPLSTPTPASEPSSQLSVASGVDNDADPDDDSVDERDPELGDTRFDVAATVDGLLAPQRSTLTLAELEEERELTRRRAHACSFLAVFVLFKLWMEAFLEEDYGLMLLCLVGTSWTARWIRHMQEREEELDRRIANYLDRSDENGNNTSAPRHDLRMLSFQAQLALAIMESQRQAMEGGYGNSEGANASPGVSEEARATWKRFVYQDVTHNHNHSSAGDHGIPKIFKKDGYGSVSQKEVGSMVEDGPHCSICLGEYEDGEEIVQLPCGHLYHEECIDSWTSNHVKCPLCNLDLEETAAASVNPSNSTSTSVV
jgi:hypothetical protein